MRLGATELDPDSLELRREGRRIAVEPKVLDLLLHLARRPGRLVTKRDLLRSVWGGVAVSDWAIARAVKEARRALGDSGRTPAILETVRGRGYRLIASASNGAGLPDREPLVGRGKILSELEARLERCQRGRAEFVLLVGPPGIGKTRLAKELASRAERSGFEVHTGRCVRETGVPAGWPWTQVLRSALEAADGLALPVADRAIVARFLPDLADPLGLAEGAIEAVPDLGPSAERFRCFDRIARLVARLAARRPRLLVLDDLQRADSFSLRLIAFLVAALDEAPVTIVGTLRDADPDTDADVECAPLLAALVRHDVVYSVSLDGLDEAAVAALWRARRTDPVRHDTVRALLASTGGNPLFLGQLLDLPDPGDLPAAARDEGVRGALRRRLEALTPACRNLLATGALLGDDFRLETAVFASGIPPDTARDGIDEALRAGVLELVASDASVFRFAHDLVAEGLRDMLPTAERARLHARIADALLALPDALQPVGSIARHLAEATASGGDPARALAWCKRAGDEAADRHAYEEARDHYAQALALAARVSALPIEQRLALEGAWLGSRLRSGDEEAAPLVEDLAERARHCGADDVLVAAALSREASGLQLGGGHLRDPLVIRLLEDALEVAPADATVARIQLQARLARRLFYARRFDRARSLAREALDLATSFGDPICETEAISSLYAVLWDPAHVEERLVLARRAISVSRRARARELEFGGRALLAIAQIEHGNVDEANDELRSLRREATALPWKPTGSDWIVEGAEAMLLLLRGRLPEAERVIVAKLRAPGVVARRADFEPLVGAQLTQLRLFQGRAVEMLPLTKSLPDRLGRGWLAAVAYTAAEAGLRDEAQAALDALAANDFADVFESVNWPVLLLAAAEACVSLRDEVCAGWIYELLAPLGDAHVLLRPIVVSYGSAARALGGLATLLGRWDEATVHLEAARVSNRRMGALPWELWTRADQARLLLRRDGPGDARAARELVAELRPRCAAIGLRVVSERLDALAAEAS